MLSKNKIDKNLKKYIKEHLSKGYTKHAVRKVLTDHGYNEHYINGLLKKHVEQQFIKKYAIIASLLFLISFFSFNFISMDNAQKITGHAAISTSNEGCCTSICEQTSRNECYGEFAEGKKCNELDFCNVGCCIDKEGYCLTNYLRGNCITSYGKSINRDCSDIFFCRNITDKSYYSRLYSIRNGNVTGISASKFLSDYYGSSFNIRFYLYDNANVVSVTAIIKDSNQTVDSIVLYDDGSHNDGAKDDSIYGNNWLSSRMKEFDGLKKLDVSIIVRYADGTERTISKALSIIVLNNNKCLPIYTEFSNPGERRGIIFAASNYDNVSNGYLQFQDDVQAFIDSLFSIDKFSANKFNAFRLDQSLSYFNVATLLSVVSSSCPSYGNKKDLVVILDRDEDYCVSQGQNIIKVNPKVLFYKNISNSEMSNIFSDFCSFILTPKKLSDDVITFVTPPKIKVNTNVDVIFDTNNVSLSFSISALNYPVNYSVFLENVTLLNKISSVEVAENLTLNLANGSNFVLIKAVDRNRNKAFAPLSLNVTK